MTDHDHKLDHSVARYLSGDMDAAERQELERQALNSPDLADRLYGAALLDARLDELTRPRAVRSAGTPAPRSGRTALRWLPSVAAVVAMVALLPQLFLSDPTPVFRGDGTAFGLDPVGAVDAVPTQFRWVDQPGAQSYRFELFDLHERLVHTIEAPRPVARVSDPSVLAQIREGGMWRVVPVGPDGRDLAASPDGWFTVLAP